MSTIYHLTSMLKTILKYSLFLSLFALAGCKSDDSSTKTAEPVCTSGFDIPGNKCYEACDTSSLNHREPVSGKCTANELSCPIVNGIGKKIWNYSTNSFGVCEVVTCNPGTESISSGECVTACDLTTNHRDPNNLRICTTNHLNCPFPNGVGVKTWDSNLLSYGTCTFTQCNAGYFYKDSTEGCISESLKEFTLNISKTGVGVGTINDGNTIYCGESCSGVSKSIVNNTNITLFIVAPSGRIFNGWGGDAASCGVNPVCQVFMNSNKQITAQFSIQSYGLSLTAPNNGSITGTSQGQYLYNTAVTLTANPISQYKFVSWVGGACAGVTTPTCTFNITSEQYISASFAPIGRPVVQFSVPSLASINSSKSVSYTLKFIDAVSVVMAASDVLQDGSAPNCSSVVVAAGSSNVEKIVTLSGCTGNGTKRIRINSGVAVNELGQNNNTSDYSSTFSVDNTPPTITVTNPAAAVSIEDNPFLVQWTSPETIVMDLQLFKKSDCSGTPLSSYSNQTSPFALTFADAGYFYVKFIFADSAGNSGTSICSPRITKKGMSIIQSGFLFKDKGSNPQVSKAVSLNGKLYLPASTDSTGQELFEYDPTLQKGILLKDIYPGVTGSNPSNLTVIGDVLYFVAGSENFGRELWSFNSITREISQVRDIYPGETGSGITSMIVYDNKLYFNANDGTSGNELWEYNPATRVAQLYADINVGSGSSTPRQFLLKDDQLYVVAYTPTYGTEIWRINFFLHNIYLTGDVASGANDSNPTNLTLLNGKIYFSAETQQINGRELFAYDIAADRTSLIADIFIDSTNNGLTPNSSNPDLFKVINNKLYFVANNGITGRELRYYDPATAVSIDLNKCTAPINSGNPISGQQCDPTVLTQDSVPGAGSLVIQPPMKVVNNSLFFIGYSAASGYELWEYRTTNNTYYQITDIAAGATSSNIGLLEYANGRLYFNANDTIRGQEMWSYDPVSQNLAIVSDYVPGADGSLDTANLQSLVIGNKIYLSMNDGIFGNELYELDTTTQKIKILADINTASTGQNGKFATIGNKVYFAAATLSQGMELWSYDLVDNTVSLVQDILLGERSSNPAELTVSNNRLYFSANGSTQGRELYYYEPSSSNLGIVSEINPGIADSYPRNLLPFGNFIYFSTQNVTTGRELYQVNTLTNTVSLVNDLNAGSSSSDPLELTLFNNRIYFSADWSGTPSGGHLFFYDPSTLTVTRVPIRSAGSTTGTKPNSLVVLNNELYLTAHGEGLVGLEPHKVTASNTVSLLKDISIANNASSYATGYTLVDGTVYFSADDGYRGKELWKYEASSGGLVNIVADLYNGLPSSNPVNLISLNSKLYFVGNDGFSGVELWSFTPATLEIKTVVDYYEGNNSGNPQQVQLVNGKIYAFASDALGNELWTYDPVIQRGYKMSSLEEPFKYIQNIYLSKVIATNEVLVLGVYNGEITLFKMFE